jgi:hypothetical protein
LEKCRFRQRRCFHRAPLSDVLLGDGIQIEDVEQAALVALVAAVIQWFLQSSRR